VCRLTPKNYNKIFLGVLKSLPSTGLMPAMIRNQLSALNGDASRWPDDRELQGAMYTKEIYEGALDAPRAKAVLIELEHGMRDVHSENPIPQGLEVLDVDHIMPRAWCDHWPLADGSLATGVELAEADFELLVGKPTARQTEIRQRCTAIRTIGNLTLLHYGVNRSVLNHAFDVKRDRLIRATNLNLNRELMFLTSWSEKDIRDRAEKLFEVAQRIWPAPNPQKP
jgi:hypothetical protein